MIHALLFGIAVYGLFCWVSGREERRLQRRVERELAEVERQEQERGEPWIDL